MVRASFLIALAIGCLLTIVLACSDEPTEALSESPVTASAVAQSATTGTAAPSTAPPRYTATTTPTATPTSSASPRHVRYAPDEVVSIQKGVFYVDPRSGAVDAWELPAEFHPVLFEVSPGGRYVAYGGPTALQSNVPQAWRLFDTQRNVVRDLPYGPPQFAPDEWRYAMAGPDGVSIVRAEDGEVERIFPISRFREPRGFVPAIAWAPDGGSLLVGFDEPPSIGPSEGRVVRLSPATGESTDVANAVLPYARWTADGRLFFLLAGDAAELRAFSSDGRLAWSVSLKSLGIEAPHQSGKPPSVQMSMPWISPDGRLVAVSLRGDSEIPVNRVYVFDTATGSTQFWVDGAYTCPSHAWTADSRWLLVNGTRTTQSGTFLVSAEGSTLRYLALYVADLSPVDAGIAGVRGQDDGLAAIHVVDVTSGMLRHSVRFSGDIGWDTNHDPIWLADGRMVAHSPHLGHGGCGEGPPITEQLTVRFPP